MVELAPEGGPVVAWKEMMNDNLAEEMDEMLDDA
jgi:hypothetical protein